MLKFIALPLIVCVDAHTISSTFHLSVCNYLLSLVLYTDLSSLKQKLSLSCVCTKTTRVDLVSFSTVGPKGITANNKCGNKLWSVISLLCSIIETLHNGFHADLTAHLLFPFVSWLAALAQKASVLNHQENEIWGREEVNLIQRPKSDESCNILLYFTIRQVSW